VLGAAVVVLLKNVASAYVDRWIMLLGFVFIFIVMFVPGGLVPGLQRAVKWLRKPRRKPVQTVPAPASHAIEEMP
jgi:branched-chain amino acid transport system permease protein